MEILLPEGWKRPRGYSNGLRVPAGRDLIVVAGMIGWDEAEKLVPGGFMPQWEQALRNVITVVAAGGGGASDIVRLTVFVIDLDDYRSNIAAIGEVWRRVLGRTYPAMALVEVKGLLEPGALVEIEALAAVPAAE